MKTAITAEFSNILRPLDSGLIYLRKGKKESVDSALTRNNLDDLRTSDSGNEEMFSY